MLSCISLKILNSASKLYIRCRVHVQKSSNDSVFVPLYLFPALFLLRSCMMLEKRPALPSWASLLPCLYRILHSRLMQWFDISPTFTFLSSDNHLSCTNHHLLLFLSRSKERATLSDFCYHLPSNLEQIMVP